MIRKSQHLLPPLPRCCLVDWYDGRDVRIGGTLFVRHNL